MPPKKTTAEPQPAASVAPGDVVLGRIKGYPWWPGKVVDYEKDYLTPEVRRSKPAKKKVFLVRFYDNGDYGWQAPSEVKPLPMKDIDTFISSSSNKKGALMNAYKTAKEPEDWEEKHQKKLQTQQARAGAKDELASDSEAGPSKGKRKRATKATAEKETTKKARTEKKTDAKASKKEDESENEIVKLCRVWRSKLQRAFLSDKTPSEEETPGLDEVFKAMEDWTPDAHGLGQSKLPKVLKRLQLPSATLPADDKFDFKSRASKLLSKWVDATGAVADDVQTPATAQAPETAESKTAETKTADEGATNGTKETNGDVVMEASNGTEESKVAAEQPEKEAEAPAAEEKAAEAPEADEATPMAVDA